MDGSCRRSRGGCREFGPEKQHGADNRAIAEFLRQYRRALCKEAGEKAHSTSDAGDWQGDEREKSYILEDRYRRMTMMMVAFVLLSSGTAMYYLHWSAPLDTRLCIYRASTCQLHCFFHGTIVYTLVTIARKIIIIIIVIIRALP